MKSLQGSILAMTLAGAAGAVTVNPHGRGDALIYPLYLSGDQDTLISLSNDSDASKAVRVRFLERALGAEVASFDVYLGPFDAWAGAITGDGGLVTITAADESCTVPAFMENGDGVAQLVTDISGLTADPLPNLMSRAAFGYVEAFELAEVSGATAQLIGERDCSALAAAWSDGGYLAANPQTDMASPGGQLAGSAWIIDVLSGEAYEYDAVALTGFSRQSRSSQPGSSTPTLASLDPTTSGQYEATVMTADGAVELAFDLPEDAISAVLTQTSLTTDFSLNPALFGEAWLYLTAPTLRFYVSPDHVAAGQSVPRGPFANALSAQGAPTEIALDLRSRSGEQPADCDRLNRQNQPTGGSGPVLVHAAVTPVSFTNEILFTNPSPANFVRAGLFDGKATFSLGTGSIGVNTCEGEVSDLGDRLSAPATALSGPLAGQTVRLSGLPVIPLLLQKIVNGTVISDGVQVLSNYGVKFEPRGELVIVP